MPPVNGTDLLWQVRVSTGPDVYATVASQRGVSFSESNETIDTSSKDARAGTFQYGRYGSTFSFEALYVPGNAQKLAIRDAVRNGTMLRIRKLAIGGEAVEQAEVLITQITAEFPDQDAAMFSGEGTINGSWGPAA